MSPSRDALIVANSDFTDPKLKQLRAPAHDAEALARVLGNPEVGGFSVEVVLNETEPVVRRKLSAFFRDRSSDDLLLLHFSCHGVKDEDAQLYFAMRDTESAHLDATAIEAFWLRRLMDRSRSRRIVMMLDCCHSGAFASGLLARADTGMQLKENLGGRGRAVITASNALQYAFEGDEVHGESEPSVFTSAVVDGLSSGAADRDGDGRISVTELFDHVREAVRAQTPDQTPHLWQLEVDGELFIAHAPKRMTGVTRSTQSEQIPTETTGVQRPVLAVSPAELELRGIGADEELPPEIIAVYNEGGGELDWSAQSTVEWIEVVQRDASSCELRLRPPRPGVNRGTVHIRDTGRGGSGTVRVLVEVRKAEQGATLEVSPPELDFGTVEVGVSCPPQTLVIRHRGTAPTPRASATAPWIKLNQVENVVTVTIDTRRAGKREGHVLVRGEAGDRVVPVRALVERGPLLDVQPAAVDFGRVPAGESARAAVEVSNKGSGDLTWSYQTAGDFFKTRRSRNRLTLALTGEAGDHVGSVWIRSNGGEATLQVRAKIAAKRLRQAQPSRAAQQPPSKPTRLADKKPAPRRALQEQTTPAERHAKAVAPKVRKLLSEPGRTKIAATAPKRANTRFAGRYQISRTLGSGSLADVYLAVDHILGRQVALKIIRNQYAKDHTFIEHLRRETRRAAGLSHPNIVSIYDSAQAEGTYYIAMEYVDGSTLKELLARRDPPPLRIAVDYGRQILAALSFAHRNGIVHGHLEPAEIIVKADGRVKVTDFGIPTPSGDESIIGTAQYLSPEQSRGAPVDDASDVYSLGVVMYEMLTGHVPFIGDTPIEIAMKHISEAPTPPSKLRPDVPRHLDEVVLRALAKTPQARYKNAAEMNSALAKLKLPGS